jgi:hypothetical protein
MSYLGFGHRFGMFLLLAEPCLWWFRWRKQWFGWLRNRVWLGYRRLKVNPVEGGVLGCSPKSFQVDVIINVKGCGEQTINLVVNRRQFRIAFFDLCFLCSDVRSFGFLLHSLPFCFRCPSKLQVSPLDSLAGLFGFSGRCGMFPRCCPLPSFRFSRSNSTLVLKLRNKTPSCHIVHLRLVTDRYLRQTKEKLWDRRNINAHSVGIILPFAPNDDISP